LREKIAKNPAALRGIVRIHYVLPKASSKCQSFHPGVVSFKPNRKIQLGDSQNKVEHTVWEIIVDVDLATMPKTGFVPRSLCASISAAFFRTGEGQEGKLCRNDNDERKRTTKKKVKKLAVPLQNNAAVAKIESMKQFPEGWETGYTVKHLDAFMAKHKIPCLPGKKGKRKKERVKQIAKARTTTTTSNLQPPRSEVPDQGERQAKRARTETKGEADLVVVTPTSKEDKTGTTLSGTKRKLSQADKNEESEDEEELEEEESEEELEEEESKDEDFTVDVL